MKEYRIKAAKEAVEDSKKKKDAKAALAEVSDNLKAASTKHKKDSKVVSKVVDSMEGGGNPHYKVKKGSY
tara:strand:- start:253 stop:462 length:210 start_codon:yes stop_codon:yes gene_type:complete